MLDLLRSINTSESDRLVKFIFVSPMNPPLVLKVNDTRVVLKHADPNVVGSDYINANYVRVRVQRRKHKRLIFCLLTLTGFVMADLCRTPCGSPPTRRGTSPRRGVSPPLSTTFGK